MQLYQRAHIIRIDETATQTRMNILRDVPCTRAFSSTFSQSYLTRIMEIKWIYIVNHVIGSIINVPTLDDHARAFNFPLHMYNFIMCYMRIHTE